MSKTIRGSLIAIIVAAAAAVGLIAVALAFTATAGQSAVPRPPMVGGAAMYPTRSIVENAATSRDHGTLVAAVKAAGLAETLAGPGPFTVFAPTDAAFAKLPAGTLEMLMKPENKAALARVLSYHVVPGQITSADISARTWRHLGRANYTTLQGGMLTLVRSDGTLRIYDGKGGRGRVTQSNVLQSNGVIHVVDTVMMP